MAMDPLDIASAVIGGIEGIGNFGFSLFNNRYQKNLQQEIFRREDTAVQRRVADLKAAGLSPTLAASGSGAGAGAVVGTESPQNDTFSRLLESMTLSQKKAEIENTNADTANKLLDNQYKGDIYETELMKNAEQSALYKAQAMLATGNYEMLGVKKETANAMISKAKAETDRILTENKYLDDNLTIRNQIMQQQLSKQILEVEMQNWENNFTHYYGTKMGTYSSAGFAGIKFPTGGKGFGDVVNDSSWRSLSW